MWMQDAYPEAPARNHSIETYGGLPPPSLRLLQWWPRAGNGSKISPRLPPSRDSVRKLDRQYRRVIAQNAITERDHIVHKRLGQLGRWLVGMRPNRCKQA